MKRYRKDSKKFNFGSFHDFAFDLSQNVIKKRIVPREPPSLSSSLRFLTASIARASIREYEHSAFEIYSQSELSAPLLLPYELSISSPEDARNLLHQKSRILDLFMARRLHSYLPSPARMEGFQLQFATYLNGWNLSTLYSLVEGCCPCVILIKSVEVEAVIGIYLSSTISPPSSSTRGDGSSFCFRLDGPDGACYRWALVNHQYVGITLPSPQPPPVSRSPNGMGSTSLSPSSLPSTTDLPQSDDHYPAEHILDSSLSSLHVPSPPSPVTSLAAHRFSMELLEPETYLGSATFHQFAHCTVDYMAFGGSLKHGTNAIRITSDLMLCSCGHSDTYNNLSLTPDEPNDPWYVAEVEVFCGSHSVLNQRK
jgi:hypothetical protein